MTHQCPACGHEEADIQRIAEHLALCPKAGLRCYWWSKADSNRNTTRCSVQCWCDGPGEMEREYGVPAAGIWMGVPGRGGEPGAFARHLAHHGGPMQHWLEHQLHLGEKT